MKFFGRRRRDTMGHSPAADVEKSPVALDKRQLKRETRARSIWGWISSLCFLIAVVFLIVCEVGTTSGDRLPNVYFVKLDLSHIVPTSVPNYNLINSVAQSLGLHDFYQVGLWNYCAGYNDQGITSCSDPRTLYWFNPIAVIQSELLAGASIPFPTEVENILHILKTASQWMFAIFLTGACLSFGSIFVAPFAKYGKLASIPIVLFTLLAAIFTTVAAVLATVIFIIFANAAKSQTQINLGASIGVRMFVFMWIAAGFSLVGFVIQLCLLCCCRSRRKVKKAWRNSQALRNHSTDTSEGQEKDESH